MMKYATTATTRLPTITPTAIPALAPPESELCDASDGAVAETWGGGDDADVPVDVVRAGDDAGREDGELEELPDKAVVKALPILPPIVVTFWNASKWKVALLWHDDTPSGGL
jgi:hypothetical protein